jgi:hypothetical protein
MKNIIKIWIFILVAVAVPSVLIAQTNTKSDSSLDTTNTTREVQTVETTNIDLQKVVEPIAEPIRAIVEPTTIDTTNVVEEEPVEEEIKEEESRSTNSGSSSRRNDDEDDNTEAKESIKTVSDTLAEIKEEAKVVESEVRAEIKNSIDKSILEIRSQTDIEAYELQRAVDDTRNEIYKDINTTINTKKLTDTEPIVELETRVESAVSDIENSLEEESGIEIDTEENIRSIKDTLLRYREVIEEKKVILEEREGNLLEQDTDGDGISDYDEKFIYKTNPESARTVEGELTDAEKISRGINPTSENNEPIQYNDPREDREAVISTIHKVERVELVQDEETQQKKLKLEGTALPNSFVTVYIFSTPTIVTVKTNERGEWSYTLDKELENGEHEVYVATVDNSGRLIARSESIAVTQTAEAAALGTFGIGEPNQAQNDFVQENFILIVIAILLAAIIITLILAGGRKDKVQEMIDDTKI